MYVGSLNVSKGTWERQYYRCSAQIGQQPGIRQRCNGKLLAADWVATLVWDDIKAFVSNPGDVVRRLQQRIEAELDTVPGAEARKRELQQAIAGK